MKTGSPALTHGLDVLRVVAEALTPITSVEVAKRVGLHQSWVSRVLKTLSLAGYVRKPSFHSFAADYGVLALGGNALRNFPLVTKPKAALVRLAAENPGMNVALAVLWQGQLIYLMRYQHGYEPVPLSVGFPLHLSSIGLRLLLELPEAEALAQLEQSRQRYGWEQTTPQVPAIAPEALALARRSVQQQCLILDGYFQPGTLGAAIPLAVGAQAALALSIPRQAYSVATIVERLHQGKEWIEAAMAEGIATP